MIEQLRAGAYGDFRDPIYSNVATTRAALRDFYESDVCTPRGAPANCRPQNSEEADRMDPLCSLAGLRSTTAARSGTSTGSILQESNASIPYAITARLRARVARPPSRGEVRDRSVGRSPGRRRPHR